MMVLWLLQRARRPVPRFEFSEDMGERAELAVERPRLALNQAKTAAFAG